MDTLKRLRNSFPLLLLIITSLALAVEPLPDPKEWVPDKVSVTIPADRQNPYALLEWKRTPVFKSTKEKTVLGIEAELVFPELKRVGAERYWPTNRLRFARAPRLPESCYYQDNYFLDRCENWTLGIEISPECLYRVLPRELEINYTSSASVVTTAPRRAPA
jgi:hypothetical protein